MKCFVICIRNSTTAFTGVVPFFTKKIFGFAAGCLGTVARRISLVRAKILMCKKRLGSLVNAFEAMPGQTTLLDSIVDGKMEVMDAKPRVGDGAPH